MSYLDYIDAEALIGKVIVGVDGLSEGSVEVYFRDSEGKQYRMFHYQDCCETVMVDRIHGNVENLFGEIRDAKTLRISGSEEFPIHLCDKPEYLDSWTVTAYTFVTDLGTTTIVWLGESNGYYSEEVDIEIVK